MKKVLQRSGSSFLNYGLVLCFFVIFQVLSSAGALSNSDKIDKIVTNRWLGLPIFAAVMFLVYWIAMVAVGAPATDWANDGLFGDGFHLWESLEVDQHDTIGCAIYIVAPVGIIMIGVIIVTVLGIIEEVELQGIR